MSLINDALKKAQRQRAQEPTPSPGLGATPPPASGPAAIRKPPVLSTRTLILVGGAAVSIGVISAGVTVFLLRDGKPSAPPAVAAAPAIATPATPTGGPTASAPSVSTPTANPTAAAPAPGSVNGTSAVPAVAPATEARTTPAATTAMTTEALAPRPSPAVRASDPTPATPAAGAPVATPVASAEPAVSMPDPHASAPRPAVVVAPPQPDARLQTFVDKLRINGIRITDTGSRVILNDRLFRIDDIVEPTLGLKLVGVEERRLTFVDNAGHTYVRRL